MAFFSLVAGMSVVSGFATTVMLAKRRDSEMFDKVVRRQIIWYDLIWYFCRFKLLNQLNSVETYLILMQFRCTTNMLLRVLT